MPYSIRLVSDIPVELLRKLSEGERFVTHAHNPCITTILQTTFGWKGGTFLVLEGDIPVGYINVMLIKGRIVSMPHFSYGGILTTQTDSVEIYSEILPKLYEHFTGVYKADVSYMLRDPGRVGVFVQDTKVISWLNIEDRTTEQAVPSPQRAKVRKALAEGLICRSGGLELLNDFYKVYSRNMLRLGSPVLPIRLFSNILKDYINGHARIFCVYNKNTPVGVAFLMSFMGFFENTWFSTNPDYNNFFPAQLLHNEMISFAIDQKAHTYSFGRSSAGSGVHEFKRRWGTEETHICWNYDKVIKVDIRKAEFLTTLWKMLPLSVANRLGPLLAEHIY